MANIKEALSTYHCGTSRYIWSWLFWSNTLGRFATPGTADRVLPYELCQEDESKLDIWWGWLLRSRLCSSIFSLLPAGKRHWRCNGWDPGQQPYFGEVSGWARHCSRGFGSLKVGVHWRGFQSSISSLCGTTMMTVKSRQKSHNELLWALGAVTG